MRVFGLLILMLAFLSFGGNGFRGDYVLLNSKEFKVKGETSVGKFSCKYSLTTKDTLFLNQTKGLADKIPVNDFRCGNFLLNRDFRKTLKARDFPDASFILSHIEKENDRYLYDLTVLIAGEEKTLKRQELTPKDNGLFGEIKLKFSDFNLEPPQKLGGAIKIEENIELEIYLSAE